MEVIGYVRLGRDGLDQQQQHDLAVLGIDQLYQDIGTARDGLRSALRVAKQGDTLVVTRLAQLGLDARGMIKFAAMLRGRGLHLAVLDIGLETRQASQWNWFSHMLALGQMERQLVREMADARLVALSKPRARCGGRPRALDPRQVEQARQAYWKSTGRTSVADLARQFGIARSTFYERVLGTPRSGNLSDFLRDCPKTLCPVIEPV
jgi:DNA invertase Pin-like site-specific DNA recombinase